MLIHRIRQHLEAFKYGMNFRYIAQVGFSFYTRKAIEEPTVYRRTAWGIERHYFVEVLFVDDLWDRLVGQAECKCNGAYRAISLTLTLHYVLNSSVFRQETNLNISKVYSCVVGSFLFSNKANHEVTSFNIPLRNRGTLCQIWGGEENWGVCIDSKSYYCLLVMWDIGLVLCCFTTEGWVYTLQETGQEIRAIANILWGLNIYAYWIFCCR